MHSREQYLEALRDEYRRADKKKKTRLLNEAVKRTRLNRKVLVRKLCKIPPAKSPAKRRKRGVKYGVEVLAPLVKVWELFECPCGQRLAPILRQQLDRLRSRGVVRCDGQVAALLERISPRTIDRLLARERQVRQLSPHRSPPVHPLLYQRVPMKTASEWDHQQVGNLQLDYVLHCGASTAGEYVVTLSATDIATAWWEGCPQLGRSQQATQDSLTAIRERLPFRLREIHPDNDSGILNDLLWNYCRRYRIAMSRSRPYQKNDNAWVEQKNRTHVREVVGHRRFTTPTQLETMRLLQQAVADFRNFFVPSMKLREKERIGGKVKRIYEPPQTPYQRVLALGKLKPAERQQLEQRYQSLDPVRLRQRIDSLRKTLFDSLPAQDPPIRPARRAPNLQLRRAERPPHDNS